MVVSGPGIIGMFCALSARSRGAEVILTGTEQDETTRLSAARTIGFETLLVGHGHPPLHEQISAYFPDGADALVEASGSAHALADSWQSVRPDGVVTAVALYSRTIDFDLTQFLLNRSISYQLCLSRPDYLRYLISCQGAVDLAALTRTIRLPVGSLTARTCRS